MSHEFGVIIAPGRFDATPAQAKKAWDKYRKKADVILATEYGSGKFDAALDAEGWDYFRGHGEGVVAWRTDMFEVAWQPTADRIGTPFFRGGNHAARTPLTQVPLRHLGANRLVMIRVPHMPAHIQAGNGFRRTTPRVVAQAAGWLSALAVIGRRSERFRENHPKAAELVAGDWNVDMHRAHWRAVIHAATGLRCVKPLTDLGDLGRRLVSWGFFRGLRVVSTALLSKQDGFDHRAVSIQFRLKGA